MANDIMVHAGGEIVTRDKLDLVPLPEATASYVPVSHYQLAQRFHEISGNILRDYVFVGEQFALARKGNQMFAALKFKSEENPDLALALAYRNSYDRSMAIGLATGATVFICDNLALSGDIVVMKKHTKNVWVELENSLITTLYKSQENFRQIALDFATMKGIAMDDDRAFRLMGLLYGRDLIGPRQLTAVKCQWQAPNHEQFKERTAYSFYNAVTEAMKENTPAGMMERHVAFHELMRAEVPGC